MAFQTCLLRLAGRCTLVCGLWLSSCQTVDLYEKVSPIPGHRWQSAHKPSFQFNITDTSAAYRFYLIVRHNNRYRFNNIWVNLTGRGPDSAAAQTVSLELPLASKEGWLGTGMDDIFEHRIAFTPDPQKFRFTAPGTYTFTLEQTMREDPLENVLDVGLRLEKQPR